MSNMASASVCKFDECGLNATARGLCYGHYQQERRGKELTPLQVYNKVEDGEKTCPNCGVTKTREEFYTSADWTSATCAVCQRASRRSMRTGGGRPVADKPRRNRVQTMIDDETLAALKVVAARDGLTVSSWIERTLKLATGLQG